MISVPLAFVQMYLVRLNASNPSCAQLRADPFDRVRETIRRQLVETQTASIAVAVARDGKILWEQGFGWADREKRIAADEHTVFSLASISKPIAATGLWLRRGK